MNKQIVFLCVGTSSVTGDSLAPVVGDILSKSNLPCFVYGTTKHNVNRKNLDSYLDFISYTHPNSILITIDSGLSKTLPVGTIKIVKGGATPGKIYNPSAKKVGNIGIVAVVNNYDNNKIEALSTVNPHFIVDFGNYIANLINNSIKKIII